MAATAAPQPFGVPRDEPAALVRRALGETAALLQVVLGAVVVVAAAERRSVLSSANHGAFTAWFAGPLQGLWPSLPADPAVLHRDMHHVLLAMLALWTAVLLAGRTVRAGVVIGAVVALNVLFLLCPPSALTDLFNYLGYARLDVVHHLNPYVDLPLAQRGDPVYAYSNWHRLRSPYGPLFTLLLLPTARLSLPVAYWTYKTFATAASLGLLAAVWACARRLGRPPAAAVAFVGLNPLVLLYALAGKHNDLLMMGCLLGGCLLLVSRRERVGGAALAAAVAIKASAGLLAPVIALGAPRRLRAVTGLVAGAMALAAVTYLAFGPHVPNVAQQDRLVNAWSLPNLAGYAAGRGGADAEVRRIALMAMLAGGAVLAAVAWRTRRWETAAGWAGLVSVASVSWLEPWYILWALPLAALSTSRTLRFVVVVVSAWLVLVAAGLVPALAHDHGIRPGQTALARDNHSYMESLLRDRPPPAALPRRRRADENARSRFTCRAYPGAPRWIGRQWHIGPSPTAGRDAHCCSRSPARRCSFPSSRSSRAPIRGAAGASPRPAAGSSRPWPPVRAPTR